MLQINVFGQRTTSVSIGSMNIFNHKDKVTILFWKRKMNNIALFFCANKKCVSILVRRLTVVLSIFFFSLMSVVIIVQVLS